jgi:hypothetical protein
MPAPRLRMPQFNRPNSALGRRRDSIRLKYLLEGATSDMAHSRRFDARPLFPGYPNQRVRPARLVRFVPTPGSSTIGEGVACPAVQPRPATAQSHRRGQIGRQARGYCRPRVPLTLLIDEAQQRLGVVHPACQARLAASRRDSRTRADKNHRIAAVAADISAINSSISRCSPARYYLAERVSAGSRPSLIGGLGGRGRRWVRCAMGFDGGCAHPGIRGRQAMLI